MNTQTHLLLAAALFARPGRPRANAAVMAGALVPDAGVYGLFAWSKLAGVPETEVWRTIYFAEPMQTIQAVCNSAPLYGAVLAIGLALGERRTALASAGGTAATGGWWGAVGPLHWLALLALAALIHLAGDLPLHADDAHRHFWPLTDWRFHSPVSYWDRDHYGGAFSIVVATMHRRVAKTKIEVVASSTGRRP